MIEVPLPKTDRPTTAINDIFAQDDRHFWLAYTRGDTGMAQDHGVLALDDNGTPADFADDRWQDYPIATSGTGGTVAVDAQGRLWYGNSANLYRYTDGQWRPFFESTLGVCDLTPDAAGTLYTLEAPNDHCNTLSGAIGMIAPDNTYTPYGVNYLVAERLPVLRAAPHRNRMWTVAPDGAVWYVARRYPPESGYAPVYDLSRQDAAGVTHYPLPSAAGGGAEAFASAVQRLEVDAHNHVWLVTGDQLWRMSPSPGFVLEVQPSTWLLAPGRERTGEITIRGREGYRSTVALAAIDAPDALTVTIEPNSIEVGQSARLTLSGAPNSVPATYSLQIQASDNRFTHTVTLTVIVVEQVHDLYLPVISALTGSRNLNVCVSPISRLRALQAVISPTWSASSSICWSDEC